MIFLFQLFFILFTLGVIVMIVRKYQAGGLSQWGMAFWVLLWLVADGAVLFPQTVTIIANHFGIGRGSDFVLYISIAIMFFILFKLQVKIELMSRDVTKVVRRDTLENVKIKNQISK